MNKKLKDKTKEWMSLERATLKQREIAEQYYATELMKLIEKEFIEKNRNNLIEKVDYMILSVGTSYEPLVLNLKLFKPKKVLFLYTEKTEKTIDKIVKYCDLDSSDFLKEKVNEVNPLSVYTKIKKAYLEWKEPNKIYIDFTGGTKAMSAAAAMAGAVIDIQLVYIGTEQYLTDFRKPTPGSERLYYISNPYEVFGDLEIDKALNLFQEYNYAGAREKLSELKEKVPEPVIRQQLNFMYLLACTYELWDSLEFAKAYSNIKQLIDELKRDMAVNPEFVLMDFLPKLNKQKEILYPLTKIQAMIQNKENMKVMSEKQYIIPLMFTMYSNSLVREYQEKYDSATLLLYRVLEMIEQRRLALHNINVSKADYYNVKFDEDKFSGINEMNSQEKFEYYKKSVNAIKIELFGKNANQYLSEQISLLDGFIQLAALKDDLLYDENNNIIDKLKRLRSAVYLRNNSIFAHGLSPVPFNNYLRFKEIVTNLFKQLCDIEEIDFDKYMDEIEWLDPSKSKYYSIGVKKCPSSI